MNQTSTQSPRKKWRQRAFYLALLAIGVSPWLIWQTQAIHDIKLVIVDKTVPVTTYREHSSLIWALNHLKVKAPNNQDQWRLKEDYIGYYPPVSTDDKGHERLLSTGDLAGQKVLFIADTYGVYQQDEAEAKRIQAPDYSKRMVGGIQASEADAIETFVNGGGHLIGEFNTFASPTSKAIRTRMENLFGLRWTGWAGRYFQFLESPTEVPAWAHRKWKAQSGKEWSFKGPGWLIDNEESNRILILQEGKEVTGKGLRIFKTQDHPLSKGVESGLPFYFWFDIQAAQAGTTVLAEYQMDLTEEGKKIWQQAGLPLKFPAVTLKQAPSLRLYMAGDASDTDLELGPIGLAGRQKFESLGNLKHFQINQAAFFWELYLPLLSNVFEQIDSNK